MSLRDLGLEVRLLPGPLGRASLGGMAVYHPVPALAEHFREAGFEVKACERVFPLVAVFEVRRPE